MHVYQALGLDLDDTLHDYSSASSKAIEAALAYVCSEYGTDAEDLKVAYDDILAAHVREGFVSGRSSEEYRRERFDKLLSVFSIFSPHDVEELLSIYQSTLDKSMSLNSGAREVLSKAKSAGLTTLVITEGPDDAQKRTLELVGLSDLVDHLVTAGAERCGKRNGLFLRALEIAACRPDEMVYVGDSYEKDIVPAQRCGIDAYFYSPRGLASTDRPSKSVDSLAELVTVIEQSAQLAETAA